jgi:hypothetical protein
VNDAQSAGARGSPSKRAKPSRGGTGVLPERTTHRNGYRECSWQTRAGEITLAIPRLRSGSYVPSFLEPRSRSEKALVAVIQEAYVNGVSTRKVDRESAGAQRAQELVPEGFRLGFAAVDADDLAAARLVHAVGDDEGLVTHAARLAHALHLGVQPAVLLIHAENGGGGEELTPEYCAAAGQPKQIWMVPGAGHTGGLTAEPTEYERRVIEFFDNALLAGSRQ